MNKAPDAKSAGYATNPLQIRAVLIKLLQHSANVARSPGEKTSQTLRHDALHVCILPGEGKAATKTFEVLGQDCVVGGEGDDDGQDCGGGGYKVI